MDKEKIVIQGARAHNLKNIDVEIPRDKLVVMTGLSGSGKSSLAFDTIYAEGQRRYVESLSAYARQFLGQMDKPDVDLIEGLSPAISIDQKTTSRNPRSTVGTVTEIHDYLRLLYARVGHPVCPNHGIEITSQTIEQMVDRVLEYPEKTRIQIMAPIVSGKKGTHKKTIEEIKKEGYVRIRVDGEIYDINDEIEIEKNKKHSIEIIIDRIVIKEGINTRLYDSIEAALRLADGYAVVDIVGDKELLFSEHYACPYCGFSVGELEPRMFSFNSPFGACPTCDGLGTKLEVDVDTVIPDRSLSLNEGAIIPWRPISSQYYPQMLASACKEFGIDMDTPLEKLSKEELDIILNGSKDKEFYFEYKNDFGMTRETWIPFEGILPNIERRYRETNSDFTRDQMAQYMTDLPCPSCKGYRLKEETLSVKVNDHHIGQISEFSINEALAFFDGLELSEKETQIAAPIFKEVRARLGFLKNVGLDYLTMSRAAGTLSGGEAQRI